MTDNKYLKALQKIELDILKSVVKICDENNIKYFMIGGTLLGAVRHNGFIPWDDDIDIAMPRKDYERFIEIWPKVQSPGLVLQNKVTDERVHLSFTKIRKRGTRIIEKETKDSGIFKGIFIDVFPLDNIPEKDSLVMDINYSIYKYLIAVTLYKNNYRLYKSKVLQAIAAISSIFLSYKQINKITYKIITKQNHTESKYCTSYASGYGYKKQRMSKNDIYGEGVMLPFEDAEFRAPTNYIGYLEHLFGNYKELPPIEKRGNQHSFIEVSLDEE